MKPDKEALADAVLKVQRQLGVQIDPYDILTVIRHAIEKAERLGESAQQVPLMVEIDLRDFVHRNRKHCIRRNGRCVLNAAATPV